MGQQIDCKPFAIQIEPLDAKTFRSTQDHEINPNIDHTSIASSACESESSGNSRIMT
jgi:hypothetical protein